METFWYRLADPGPPEKWLLKWREREREREAEREAVCKNVQCF